MGQHTFEVNDQVTITKGRYAGAVGPILSITADPKRQQPDMVRVRIGCDPDRDVAVQPGQLKAMNN